MSQAYIVQCFDKSMGEDWLDAYVNPILDAKYNQVSTDKVVERQDHLSARQKSDLRSVLSKYKKLFSGELGVYPHKKFIIEVKPDAKPVHT